MSLQERIIDGTLRAVSPLKPAGIALGAVFYAVFIGVVYYLLVGTVDLVAGLMSGLCGIAYAVFRAYFTHRQFKAGIAAHLAYLRTRHPQLELYVPMIEKLGRTTLLKRSALFIEDGALALEAFNQPGFAKTPKDSITVPAGVDFRIFEVLPEPKTALVGFRSELMRNPYRFHIVNDDETVARIMAFAEPPAPAAEPTSAPAERNE